MWFLVVNNLSYRQALKTVVKQQLVKQNKKVPELPDTPLTIILLDNYATF